MVPFWLRRIARVLHSGGIIAYPTEAVFGLGCDPCNVHAVQRLLAIKCRPAEKGLILIAASFEQLEPWIDELPAAAMARALGTWPGPITWLWPARPRTPIHIRGRHSTLAVRVTAHPLAADLCRAFGGALVSTSANRSGASPARSATRVRAQMGRDLDAVVPGMLGGVDRPTEIRDVLTGRVVRSA